MNELLRPYEALHWFMDAWLVLAVPGTDASVVHRWRLQAEQAMRATGRGGLSDKQGAEFVGAANYGRVASATLFEHALWNTLIYVAAAIPLK